ncbi:MAG: hypothetical protein IKO27_06630 [Ruminococcus sp.]|nr:hypothetical protein [Ruminococcus sp.]
MQEIYNVLSWPFIAAGFTFCADEEHGQELLKNKDEYFAVPKLKKTVPSETVIGFGVVTGREKRFTAEVKCFGTRCGFSDGNELEEKVRQAEAALIYSVPEPNAKWLSTGELTRDAASGRLTLTARIEITGYEEAGDYQT